MDELTKDLLKNRHRLQATEEEKRGKEEEAAIVRFFICLLVKPQRLNVLADMHE